MEDRKIVNTVNSVFVIGFLDNDLENRNSES
jgi:hypothetical protein